MRIRLVAVPPTDLAKVAPMADALRRATAEGTIAEIDAATARLLVLVKGRRSVDLAEEEWHQWVRELRAKSPDFRSDYLIPGERCTRFFPRPAAGVMILQLPLGEEGSQ